MGAVHGRAISNTPTPSGSFSRRETPTASRRNNAEPAQDPPVAVATAASASGSGSFGQGSGSGSGSALLGGGTIGGAASRSPPEAQASLNLQIQCYQCRGLMNLNQRTAGSAPTAVQCPYCNTINGIGQRAGAPRAGGLVRNDLDSIAERERRRNRAEGRAFRTASRRGLGGSGSDSDGDDDAMPARDRINEELMQRLQQFRRMNQAELMLVREVLEQLNGQAPPPSNGATDGQIDRLTVAWTSTDKAQVTGNCTICLEDFEKGQAMRTLPCFHSFHSECVKEWLSKNKVCPICQFDIAEGAQAISDVTSDA